MIAEAQASAEGVRGREGEARPVSAQPAAPLASSRLMAEAQRLEAALDRFRAWYAQRAREEAALIAQLNAHRAKTAQGVQKADELSATLAGIRLKLQEETSPSGFGT